MPEVCPSWKVLPLGSRLKETGFSSISRLYEDAERRINNT